MNARHLIGVIVFVLAVHQHAPYASAQAVVPDTENSAQQIQQWIEQLDARRFSDRARAALELQRSGAAAIKPLEKVILQGSSEAAERALGILKRNFLSDTPKLSDPARAALQRIANTKNHRQAPVAQRILTPLEPAPKLSVRPPRLIQMPPVQMNMQVQIETINGKRDIKITENGRKFRFRDEGDGIAVERPDDRGGVKKETYKNKDELKEKDPEAHKIYERYTGKGNRIQIQFGQPFQRQFPRFQIQPRIELRQRRELPQLEVPRRPAPLRPVPPRPAPKPKLQDAIEV